MIRKIPLRNLFFVRLKIVVVIRIIVIIIVFADQRAQIGRGQEEHAASLAEAIY